jgi:energy-coupling factor transporter ATP-binding protein EcfA2
MAQDIRSTLEKHVVLPIFREIEKDGLRDQSLPEIVLKNTIHQARERVLDALVSRGTADLPAKVVEKVESLVREWQTRSFEPGFSLIRDFEIQCAQDHDLVMAEESGDPEQVLAVLEKEYRRRVVEQFGSVELRGIQVSHRVILDLDKVYVPLHVEKAQEMTERGQQTIRILDHRLMVGYVLSRQRRTLITGAPGSGKSTLISFLATGLADGRLVDELGWSERPVPLVIVVRTLRESFRTINGLATHLALDQRLAEWIFSQGRVVLFVDGLDEAPESVRSDLTAWLAKTAETYPAVRMIVTSRPTGMFGEMEKCLVDFHPYRLAELSSEDVEEFIDKWCLAAESSVRKDSEAQEHARAAADDLKSRISQNRSVQRIAVNPLLTTILCVVHRFLGRSIPEHRVTLYEKCTDLLLYEWDRAKFPEGAAVGGLDAPQKRALLRGVARLLHDRHEAEISEDQVVEHFARMLPELGRPESDAIRIVHEIRDRSGLLVERRPGFFGFSHLTFQEYLAALDYSARGELKQLVDHWKDAWWHEVIALAAGVPGGSSGRIAQGLLAKKNDVATVLAAQCLETAIDMPLKVRQRIEMKLEGLVPPRDTEVAFRLMRVGMTVAPMLLKALQNGDGDQRVYCLYALEGIDYEPAIPVIVKCCSDVEDSPIWFEAKPLHHYQPSVGEYAIQTLFQKAASSEAARRALAGVLRRPQNPEFLEILAAWASVGDNERAERVRQMIREALKAAKQDTSTSTRARSTG